MIQEDVMTMYISPEAGETYERYFDRGRLAKNVAAALGLPEPQVAPWYWREPASQRTPTDDLEAYRAIAAVQSGDPRVQKAAQAKLDAARAAGERRAASLSRSARAAAGGGTNLNPDSLLKAILPDVSGFQRRVSKRYRKQQVQRQIRELRAQRKSLKAVLRG